MFLATGRGPQERGGLVKETGLGIRLLGRRAAVLGGNLGARAVVRRVFHAFGVFGFQVHFDFGDGLSARLDEVLVVGLLGFRRLTGFPHPPLGVARFDADDLHGSDLSWKKECVQITLTPTALAAEVVVFDHGGQVDGELASRQVFRADGEVATDIPQQTLRNALGGDLVAVRQSRHRDGPGGEQSDGRREGRVGGRLNGEGKRGRAVGRRPRRTIDLSLEEQFVGLLGVTGFGEVDDVGRGRRSGHNLLVGELKLLVEDHG